MASRDTYVLHVYRSRAVRGRQWAARLDHLPHHASLRFTDPELLLAHLAIVLRAGEQAAPIDTPPGADGPPRAPEEGGRDA